MITLFDQKEVIEDLIVSEAREMSEKVARSLYENGVSIDILAKSYGVPVKTIEKWLNIGNCSQE